jgi:hypothetical protein
MEATSKAGISMSGLAVRTFLAASVLLSFFIVVCMQSSLAQSQSNASASSDLGAPQLAGETPVGDLLYSDSFTTRKESGWNTLSDANVTRLYKTGRYHIKLLRQGWSAWAFSGQSLQDFAAKLNASQAGGPDDNDYGLVTRYLDAGNYSLFLVSGDGFFAYGKMENGQWKVPVKWTRSQVINQGNATNNLLAISRGENLTFYVNDVKVGDFIDSNPVSGDIGLWVEDFSEGGVDIGFDDLKIWALKR